MAFELKRDGQDLVVNISGTLTFHQHKEGEQMVCQVTNLVDKGEVSGVRMNFAAAERIDSHWLGIVIRILRRVHDRQGQFVIEKPSPDISRLFEMVELSRIAEIRA